MFECARVLAVQGQAAGVFIAISPDNWCFVRNFEKLCKNSSSCNLAVPARQCSQSLRTLWKNNAIFDRPRPTRKAWHRSPRNRQTDDRVGEASRELLNVARTARPLHSIASIVVTSVEFSPRSLLLRRTAARSSNDLVNNWVRQLFRNEILGLILLSSSWSRQLRRPYSFLSLANWNNGSSRGLRPLFWRH